MIGHILSEGIVQVVRDWFETKEGNYLEIGVYNGVFISELARKYPDKKIYAIDPFVADGHTGQPKGDLLSDAKNNTYKNIEGLTNVVLWEHTTKECFDKNYYHNVDNITCVLIDGSHHYEDIVVDIDFVSNIKTNLNMLILFDDLHIPDVRNAIEYFQNKLAERICNIIHIPNAAGFELKEKI